MKPVAVQLYSLRAEAEKDFPAVLKRVADIGYKGVETAGLHGHNAKEIGKIIADLGMQVCSCHADFPAPENINSTIDAANELGTNKVVSGLWIDDFKDMDACKKSAAKFSQASQMLKDSGLSFAFHNHWAEFGKIDGRYAYDIVMQEDPSLCSELDVYWTTFAKADAAQVVSKYKSNIPILHIKDGNLQEPREIMAAVGSGLLPMPSIINAADPDVLEWLVVELDAFDGDMFEAVEASYKYLTSNGLAEGNK